MSIVYLDASALVKLVVREPESTVLADSFFFRTARFPVPPGRASGATGENGVTLLAFWIGFRIVPRSR